MLPKDGFDIVISGIGAKFPETNNITELQEKLFEKANLITEDGRRWNPGIIDNIPKSSGKILDENKFDAGFNGVHRRLAMLAEPMMKLAIERSFEAMVDAGVNPFSLWGSNIAVFVATVNSESETMILSHEGFSNGSFGVLGQSQAIISNRISFLFNFVGPSVTINAGMGGGMAALKQAATLIRDGRASAALVSTAYIMWTPFLAKEYTDLKLLTFNNKNCSFDADADGFVRSDGIVTYFLQRKEDANRIYATVVDVDSECLGNRECSFINFDKELEQFLNKFYKESNCDPSGLAYMEPEGMAVKAIDTVELNSLANVVLPGRESPLLIGSVKSNIGYSHVAATFTSMAKAIIAMERGVIPPTLHYKTPNPRVPALVSGSLSVVTENTVLPGELVAVNSLSLSGVAGHLVLQRHSKEKTGNETKHVLPRLVLVSARHEEGAKAVLQTIQSMQPDAEYLSLVNNVFKTNIQNYIWRGYTVLSPSGTTISSDVRFCISEKKRPLWFVLSGMGSQWTGMGTDLLQIPIFASAIDKCDKVLNPRGLDIKKIITTEDKTVFENILNSFVGITAIQIGIVDILKTVGVEPDGIIGHSAGELCCGYADGCLTAEETVLAAYMRGKAVQEGKLCRGMMAAVGLGYQTIKDLLPATVDVACHNAADSSTISGPLDDVLQVVEELKAKGVFVKAVNSSERAFHSRYVKVIARRLENMLKEVIPKPRNRSSRWVSTSVPEKNLHTKEAKQASASYYCNNMISPVYFEEGCTFIPEDAIVVEIAPHGLLQAVLRRSLGPECVNISLTNRTAESNTKYLLSALGKLYLNGVNVDINALYPAMQYPVTRGTPSLAPLVTWDHADTWFTEFAAVIKMLTEEKSELNVSIHENSSEYPLWAEHCVDNEITVPSAQLLSYPWKIIIDTQQLDFKDQAIEIENVVISGRVPVKNITQEVKSSVFRGSRGFEVALQKEEHLEPYVTGMVSSVKRPSLSRKPLLTNGHPVIRVSCAEFYRVLSQHGYQLGPKFQTLQSLKIVGKDCEAVVLWSGDMVVFLESLFKLAIFLQLQSPHQMVELISFRRLIIDTPHFSQLPAGSEVQVLYNTKANSLVCEGVLLDYMQFSSKDRVLKEITTLNWKSVKFVPYHSHIPKLEDFLGMCIQLIAEQDLSSWSKKNTYFISLAVKEDIRRQPFSLVTSRLQNILKAVPQLQVSSRLQLCDVHRVKEDLKHNIQQFSLIIGDYKNVLSIAETANRENVFYLALVPRGVVDLGNGSLQPILKHRLKGETLVLLKKLVEPCKLRVFELDWMAGLRQFMNHNSSAQHVIVVSRHWQPRQALRTLALESYAHKLRCVFLDKEAPLFSQASPQFQEQLALGLSVNVLRGQHWGSYRTMDVQDIIPESDMLLGLESSQKSLHLSCIAFNTKTFTVQSEVTPEQAVIKYVDYCGSRRNGERVMGVGKYDQSTKKMAPDGALFWNVPQAWTEEEAVTVPFVYSLAYYSLLLKAKLRVHERVLVHGGMSLVGQAAIAISLDMDSEVYVTVTSDTQVTSLMALFPQIIPSHIINMDKSNFEVKIKQLTLNKGVNVIINCLKTNMIDSSMRLLAKFSRLVHLSEIKIEDRKPLGMFPFSKGNTVYGVNLDSLMNSDEEEKKNLKLILADGITRGVVKPLKRNKFSIKHASEALSNLRMNNTLEKTVVVKSNTNFKGSVGFQSEPGESFIVVGTKHGVWLDVAEWLLRNGARKIIIVSHEQDLGTNISRKFNNFMIQHHATLVMMSISRLDTLEKALELLREAAKIGPLAGIFCSSMEENSAAVAHLDSAARLLVPQLRQFVCLLGGSASVCESRAQEGLSACLIQSETPLARPQAVLPYLASILTDQRLRGHIFQVSESGVSSKQKGLIVSLQEVQKYLPSSLEELAALGQCTLDTSTFREHITRSPKYHFVRYQLLPVFLLPGVSSPSLAPLMTQLMHPAFCLSHPPALHSIDASAKCLIQQVVDIQGQGPYNLIAESWSGAVALQLAVMLEDLGHQVELFLLEAAPATAQHWIQAFCISEEFSSARLLTCLLNLEPKVSKELSKLTEWTDQVQFALQHVQGPSRESLQFISEALTFLRNHLLAILSLRLSNRVFSGTVHLFRTASAPDRDYCGLKEFCKKTPVIYVTEDDTLDQMFKNPTTAATINENLLFTWNL